MCESKCKSADKMPREGYISKTEPVPVSYYVQVLQPLCHSFFLHKNVGEKGKKLNQQKNILLHFFIKQLYIYTYMILAGMSG